MSDIVERLRGRLRDQETGPPMITYPEIEQAADEIERLRSKIADAYKSGFQDMRLGLTPEDAWETSDFYRSLSCHSGSAPSHSAVSRPSGECQG